MVATALTDALEARHVSYELVPHEHTERAADEARVLGMPPDAVAKTIVLRVPRGYVRAVVPASERLDVRKVRDALGIGPKHVHLADEEHIASEYAEFEVGAVPPLGGREDRVLVDRRLAMMDEIVFEAGSHDESVCVRTDDLIRATGALIVEICADY
jgi:Ala-tRNA(Pro) deacylase